MRFASNEADRHKGYKNRDEKFHKNEGRKPKRLDRRSRKAAREKKFVNYSDVD